MKSNVYEKHNMEFRIRPVNVLLQDTNRAPFFVIYLLLLLFVILVRVRTFVTSSLLLCFPGQNSIFYIQSTLVISKSKGPLKHFEISVLRHIRCAELRKIPIEQPSFTSEHVS